MTDTPDHQDPDEHVVTHAQLKRERLRFIDFRVVRTPAGLIRSEVELEWMDGARVVGRSEGMSSTLGDLRLAAEAALHAIRNFSQGALNLSLIGVKGMRVFDANVVIVAVGLTKDHTQTRLLGCYLAEDDSLRAAVLAVLNATNRVLGNFIATR